MTKLGLRDSVLTLTLIPTVIIGLLLGGYFTVNRYIELDEILYQQGATISEPLAIALEQPLLDKNKVLLNRLISFTHNRHSPSIKSIAIFDTNNELLMTSNYHRSFDELINQTSLESLKVTKIESSKDIITFYTPIIGHSSPNTQWDSSAFQTTLGTVILQLNKDKAVIGQQRALLVSGIVIILSLVLAAIMAFKLSRMFMTPLNKLVLATDKLVEGKRSTGLTDTMLGEFDILREGLNTIADTMVMQKDEMQKNIDQATSDYRETLEQYETQNIQLTMAKKEAQDANRVKSDFLAKMSHELRTPLNGVMGFTRQLYKTPLNKHQKDYLDTIMLSANSLMTIISDILDFSKLEAGAMELESIQFQLRDAVNEVMTLLAPSAHEKQLELSIYINPQVPDDLTGDPTRFKQVLINLLSNAIKFTEQGSIKVDISYRLLDEESASVLVSVTDTGVGIPMDKQDSLFTPFGQADSSITRKFGGTGLGLIITKHIVEAMNGRISLNSAPGNGTCFTFNSVFRLPNHVFTNDLPSKSLIGKRILYLEPHEHTHHAVLSLLTEWQANVTPCFNEASFLSAIENTQTKFDICLIGHMASVDHMQLLKGYVKTVRDSTDYLYLMLNTVSHNMREAFIGSGADACLSKPLNHRKLCEVLAAPYRLDHPVHNIEQSEQKLLPLKVLVVDDNDANLKLICTLLDEQVEVIDTAHNGSQAYSLSKSHKYDVIFMDIQMPIMDGITACKLIQESSLNEDTPIIAVTAHALHSEKEQLLKDGFKGYLTKPIDEDTLKQIISDHSPQTPINRDKSKNEIPQSPAPFESSRIDWPLALQRAGGKNELALEMLNMLLLSVPETLNLLTKAIDDEDCEQVLSIVHKFHGACCYTGVPKLKSLAETIETSLKNECVLENIEPELFELQDELENLLVDAKMNGKNKKDAL
ncbi:MULTISPECIES: two-component sensor histidine kinase BarA [unclassified Pseudoalteromonas]|uniref:two-component sensor histidine kinase BarA n=1 Tax=unclassified Pseudoalteromonas TaxID=194690 RepID=UPI0011093791|nr:MULTISPECIES: two-component sensor histidine kinase BarA [unclassified Pseudoalteromonas]TMN85893.1 two-component sensor histidine kinase BarA [Pseudoalteromonas sp. S410]TMN93222.1 two-component sensor histidine kinase BarA [Pseudoalteromonas sp. S408]TMN99712.1 two-component sensor histidine kinase BarA [Pseudoalteromonas sp. S407]TMO00488.1 two-component sensor histidine kinase BarA [Pseudoalteromonas sp. S409]TMO12578.1 two-component sensor histidine kinase BarA [Pseudoalteromonas sp. S